jgi:ADP-heptose:LPS heptosyltransferase
MTAAILIQALRLAARWSRGRQMAEPRSILVETAALIHGAAAFVGNDSGPRLEVGRG